jgi:hypothetical protein
VNPVMVNRDEEHLKLLAIFHYVLGGMMAFFACFGLIYVVMGLVFSMMPASTWNQGQGGPPPAWFGLLFVFIGGIILLLGCTVGGLIAYAGRCIARRRHHTFCLVMAAIACLWVPIGTVLGVLAIIVLVRPSVKPLFGLIPPAA